MNDSRESKSCAAITTSICLIAGQEALNRFLVRYAFQNQQAEASQTYVALVGDEVIGFYTLVVAQVEYETRRNVWEKDSRDIRFR